MYAQTTSVPSPPKSRVVQYRIKIYKYRGPALCAGLWYVNNFTAFLPRVHLSPSAFYISSRDLGKGVLIVRRNYENFWPSSSSLLLYRVHFGEITRVHTLLRNKKNRVIIRPSASRSLNGADRRGNRGGTMGKNGRFVARFPEDITWYYFFIKTKKYIFFIFFFFFLEILRYKRKV